MLLIIRCKRFAKFKKMKVYYTRNVKNVLKPFCNVFHKTIITLFISFVNKKIYDCAKKSNDFTNTTVKI